MRHGISQRVLALLCAGTMAGCAGGGGNGQDDGSAAERPGAAPAMYATGAAGAAGTAHAAPGGSTPAPGLASVVAALGAAAPSGTARGGRAGALEVTVTFGDAPPHLRRSAGRNACGAARPPRVRVHTMGGVAGAVVYLRSRDGETAPPLDREPPAGILAVRQCRVEPRVVVAAPGQTLAVINDDERRLDVRIDRPAPDAALPALPGLPAPAGGQANSSAPAAGTLALPVVGSRADLRWPEPGVYRVAATDTEPGFVVVPEASRAGVTNTMGQVRLAALPIGSYDLIVWHPPLNDGDKDDGDAPIIEQAQVTIAPGETSRLTIPLTPR